MLLAITLSLLDLFSYFHTKLNFLEFISYMLETNLYNYKLQFVFSSCKYIYLIYSTTTTLVSCFANVLHKNLLVVAANLKLYSTNSLRIGGATAATAGVQPTLIRNLGHWRSNCY